jgi:hyperosmotically inducible protein
MGDIMLNLIRNRTFMVAALLAMLVAGCANNRTAGETVDDGVILTRVKTALVGNPQTKAHQINIEVYQGEVQLNGFVDSQESKNAAATVTKGVTGVKSVRNNLQLRAAERGAGAVVDDSVITAKVKTALIGDSRTKAHQIEVKTNAGVVQLGGFVDTAEARKVAAQLAGDVEGVTDVRNGIEVRAP